MKKGFTLIEFSVALVLLGVTIALGYRLFFYTQSSFDRGEDRVIVQQDVKLAAELITREIQKASYVEILDALPASFESSKRYLYVDAATGKLKQVINGTTNDALGILSTDVSFSALTFSRNATDKDILSFEVNALSGTQSYATDSELKVLNLPFDKDVSVSASGSGGVICYSYSGNAKSLDVFAIRTDNNPLYPDPFQIDNPPNNIVWWYKKGVAINNLIPYFEYTGKRITVSGAPQISGFTAHDFSGGKIVEYIIEAEDGSTEKYTVSFKELVNPPPEAANVKFLAYDSDGNAEMPNVTSTLKAEPYDYISNGNGAEGSSQFQWQVCDTEFGTYTTISGQTTKQLKPVNLKDKWVRFGVRPIASNGVTGQFYYSPPAKINFAIVNLFWKHFIDDLYFMGQPVSQQPVDFKPSVKVRKDYLVESKLNPNKDDLNLTISYPKSAGSTVASGGSHIYKDINQTDENRPKYVDDLNSFSITVDAEVKSGSGYGVLLYGAYKDTTNNKEDGYMFQFDPGWNGFLIRKIENGKHDPWWRTFGMVKNLNMADKEKPNYDYGRYTPQDIRNQYFRWPTDDTNQNIAEWQKRYKTELVLQRQMDNSLIFKATVIDANGNRSNEMWFGGFGTYTADIYSKNAVKQGSQTYYGKGLSQFPAAGGTLLGLRTWDAGGSSYQTVFQEVTLGPGFAMNITSAEFVSNKKIKVRFDKKLDSTIRTANIKYGSASIASAAIVNETADNQYVMIDLAAAVSDNDVRYGIDSKLSIQRGGIRQLYAGDVNITNGTMYDIAKDVTLPEVTTIKRLGWPYTNVNITFSEDIDSSSAQVTSNYMVNGINQPTSVSVNNNVVTLTFKNAVASNSSINISGVKDKAGNTMNPYNSVITN